MVIIGEIAGLLTSLFFAVNAVVVTKAGQKVGSSLIINRTRVVFALLYLVILNFVLYHQALPLQAGTQHWTWLSLSGVIGLALGDAFLFQAYLMVGARLGTLLLSLSTIFGALEAWIFFGKSLSQMEIVGIALTLGGIIWVILEHGNNKSQTLHPSVLGILCGVLAAIGQATGLVFSKQGMLDNFSPISGNVIRMLAAVIALWLITFMQHEAGKTIQTLKGSKRASIAGARHVNRTRDRSFIIFTCGSKHSRRHRQCADLSFADLHASHQPFLFQRASRLASHRRNRFGNDRCFNSLFGLKEFNFFQFQEV